MKVNIGMSKLKMKKGTADISCSEPGVIIEEAVSIQQAHLDPVANWSEHEVRDGRTNFYNAKTKQYCRDKPESLKSSDELLLANCPWKEYKSDAGKVFFHNIETKESVWIIPKELRDIKDKIEVVERAPSLELQSGLPLGGIRLNKITDLAKNDQAPPSHVDPPGQGERAAASKRNKYKSAASASPSLLQLQPGEPPARGIRSHRITDIAKDIVAENVVTNILSRQPVPQRRDSPIEVTPSSHTDSASQEERTAHPNRNKFAASRGLKSRGEEGEGSWPCEICEHRYNDEKVFLEHQARCKELTFGGDGEEGKNMEKNYSRGEEFEVNKILARKEVEGVEMFEVLWKLGDRTWEKRSNLKEAEDTIKDFFRIEAKFRAGAQLKFFESLERCAYPGCHNVGYVTRKGLDVHVKNIHERTATRPHLNLQLQCNLCDVSCQGATLLQYHKERMHYGLVYSCGDCDFMCVNIVKAKAHSNKLSHSMDRFETGKDIFWMD